MADTQGKVLDLAYYHAIELYGEENFLHLKDLMLFEMIFFDQKRLMNMVVPRLECDHSLSATRWI